MTRRRASRFSLISCATLLIAACGGGGTPAGDQTSAAPDKDTVSTGPSFGDCFKLTSGVKFVKSNGYKQLIVQEQFEGKTVTGDVELRPNDTRFGVSYVTVDADYVHLLGTVDYDGNGAYSGKDVYSAGARLPVNTTAGQTVQISFTNTETNTMPAPSTSTSNVTLQLTFAGFEDLTLGGRTFKDVCKITTPSHDNQPGHVDVSWFAQGFGVIRSEKQDAQGVVVPNSRKELATIVSAP